ncbi:hypothetical protein CROQUDRAFT_100123 [Cronartium quercuum f. sp. fusiforme G11]|uniref:Uncharacterized protein n=1 Tax=Cronartium quercuum f. sp. fusiforme G11 TaxID=708437 RepID=A0A9P6NAI4_9BASI|nr:hypothetical protein CROQUDRAFT_100123 [Cronartium quercuum f. sp. fusiforme G11]
MAQPVKDSVKGRFSLPSLPPVPSTSLPEFSASDQSLLPSTLSSCTRYQCTRNPNHLQFSQFLIFHLCFPPSVGLVHTSASDMGRVNYSPNFKVLTITLMESGMSARATQQYLLSRVTHKTLAVWRKLYRETLAVIWDPASYNAPALAGLGCPYREAVALCGKASEYKAYLRERDLSHESEGQL